MSTPIGIPPSDAAMRGAVPAAGEETYQARVKPWMDACFGPEISNDKIERNHRFIEEALELVQSTGCTRSEAHQLVDYVFGRPVGEPHQEVGGVMVTLAALCLANSLDMHEAGEIELARIWTKVEKIRAKQAAKPKHSPLPAAPSPALRDAEVDRLKARVRELTMAFDAHLGTPCEQIRHAQEVEALTADLSRAHDALRNIQWEAERPSGGYVHLKRVIGLAARAALADAPAPAPAETKPPVDLKDPFEKLVTRIQNEMSRLYVDDEGDIMGTGPVSYAIARLLPAPAPAPEGRETERDAFMAGAAWEAALAAPSVPIEEGREGAKRTVRSWESYQAENSEPSPFTQRLNEEMGR